MNQESTPSTSACDFAIEAAQLMADSHCTDILLYDVRGISQLTDYVMIATGTSDRQIKSVADHVEELGQGHGMHRLGVDRDDAATWLVLDFTEVMIHLFEPNTRAHYDLEMMWGDAPKVAWKR